MQKHSQLEQELAREQQYVDMLYARLAELTRNAERDMLRFANEQSGGTHQNRSERDAMVENQSRLLSTLRTVTDKLTFGKMDDERGKTTYLGKLGLATD